MEFEPFTFKPYTDYSGLTAGLTALGKGIGGYLENRKNSQLGNDVAEALTGKNTDLDAVALKYAKAGKPEVALKILQYKQAQDAKNAPEWYQGSDGNFYNRNSPTNPGLSSDSQPSTYQYPPGVDTPAQRATFDKARVTQMGKEQAQQSGPAAVKGREDVSSSLSDMLDAYLDLGARKGQVSPNQTWQENLGASAGAMFPSVGGTGILGNEMLARSNDIQTIQSIQPGLLLAIKQAKQQGARGLDSNVELQFYLKQATDPTYGRDVNLAAIDRLDRAYGLGGLLEKRLGKKEYARIRGIKLNLPSNVRETQLDDQPYDAAQEGPDTSTPKWAPGDPLPSPGWYMTPKGRFHYLGNDQWSDQ